MAKKKNSVFNDVMDTTKLTMGVGVATGVAAGFNSIAPKNMQKNTNTTIGMMGAIPVLSAGKTTLRALRDWEDLDI